MTKLLDNMHKKLLWRRTGLKAPFRGYPATRVDSNFQRDFEAVLKVCVFVTISWFDPKIYKKKSSNAVPLTASKHRNCAKGASDMCVKNITYLSAPAVAPRHLQRRCCGPRTLTGENGIGGNAFAH